MKFLKYYLGTGATASILLYYNRDNIANKYVIPKLYKCDPERAHNIAINLLALGIKPNIKIYQNDTLNVNLWNRQFGNPVGLAAGFDKNARAYQTLNEIGFGFIEVGTVTPLPQKGNPKPRIFRFDNYIKNRCGLNNDGLEKIIPRLKLTPNNILGVSLGINENTENIIDEFNTSVCKVNDCSDYIVLNISCPNIAHNLQNDYNLIDKIVEKSRTNSIKPLLIKISSDIEYNDLKQIAKISIDHNLDGIIIGNTKKCLEGGLSGMPIKDISNKAVRDFYYLTNGKIPIIGVGGIFTGKDAYQRIKDGASLVQIYSSFIFNGPEVVNDINQELNELLQKDGYSNIQDVVGANHTYYKYLFDYLNYHKKKIF